MTVVTRAIGFCLLSLMFQILPAAAADDLATIKKRLADRFTDLAITEVRPSPIPGLYEMVFGARTALVTADGHYLINGELIDLESRRNLTAEHHAKLILKAIDALGENNMIVLGPADAKRTITVFTDVDCPYCARLHTEVPRLNAAGVKVRYLLFPRAGKDSETYKRSVAVWCAKDRAKALGIAKGGGAIEMKTCANPVDAVLKLAEEVNVEGTPTLVFDDGRVVPGYAPADKLLAALGLSNGEKATTRQ